MNPTETPDYEYELEDQRPVVSIEELRQKMMNEIRGYQPNTEREVVLVSDTENTPMTREVVRVSDTENTPMTREVVRVSDTENTPMTREVVRVSDVKNPSKNVLTREVYKDKKIERSKDCSLASHEEPDEICLRPSDARGEEQNPLQSLKATPSLVESFASAVGDSCSEADTNTTSRVFTGITAQQAIGPNLKVFVTLQTAEMSDLGGVVKLTAELKRPKRICELKPCEDDTPEFAADFDAIKAMILSMSLIEREGICLGRLHDCGKRDLWYANMFLLGKYNAHDVLETVTVYVDNEEYQIEMDQHLSTSQLKFYKCAGLHGSIAKKRSHPTWQTANVVAFK